LASTRTFNPEEESMSRILFALTLALAACRGRGEDAGCTQNSVCEAANMAANTDDDSIIDVDNDGVSTPTDCDDTNASVNPMTVEVCDDIIDNECDGVADAADPDCWGPFEIVVEAMVWTPYVEGWSTCDEEPTLEYMSAGSVAYGESLTVTQYQSWPVYVSWTSAVPVTVPALGLDGAELEGEAWLNPWQDLTLEFCNGYDCTTSLDILIATYAARADCASQTVDGMYESSPDWTESMGESYGVSNMDSAYSSHYSCTDWAPSWACPATDDPNEEECDEYGCECNLDPWTNISASQVQYRASVTSSAGVSAPWFTDRWETGGMHADNDGSTVFRMYTEVSLSMEEMIFRPVIDMRTNWDGGWDTIPGPDGWEGPPLFRNSVNGFIAPADGFWPIEWEANPTDDDLWMQPVWNIIVRPGAEAGTADLRNLRFQACGTDIDEISCGASGCSY
jgi:hypothetical protein